MLNVMASTAKSENPGLARSNQNRDEDNVEWLNRHAKNVDCQGIRLRRLQDDFSDIAGNLLR